jgi:GNAT superfamily N-acetyltransferase
VQNVVIRQVRPSDFERWLPLWDGYNSFYERVIDRAVTTTTWARFFDCYEPVHAFVAERDGSLIGLVHYLFHRSTATVAPVCYLQDLFTTADARGQGIGRRLIEAVYAAAAEAGSPRVYWLTHETNAQARILYDQVAERSGFIQYRKQLPTRSENRAT